MTCKKCGRRVRGSTTLQTANICKDCWWNKLTSSERLQAVVEGL